ncbi:MAG: DNA (cytosine-5)-methyltransferase 1 [Phenylobacterium sp.]|jgi:DNA (cytosine-5)-methyltransferase 1
MSAIDLFAGAGGFSLAAHQLDIDVLAAIELDAAAARTYRENLIERLGQGTNLINGDILEINPGELREELGLEKGELQLILGGPPCQGFSSHRIKDAGIDDPRNKLLLRYYDFVEEFQPKAFLVENVTGLLWKRHADYLERFKALAQDNGYTIHFCNILNAKDYGVPQNRKRVFIYGVRNDVDLNEIAFPPQSSHFAPNSTNVLTEQAPAWKTASTVFEPLTAALIEQYIVDYFEPKTKLSDEDALALLQNLESGFAVADDDPCKIHMTPGVPMVVKFIATPLNGSREDAGEKYRLRCHSNGYKGHKDVYGRVLIHLPSNTITTGCNNPSKGRFVHPWENHGFTLRHAARLQSFPDDFIFTGSTTEQAKQIGNAVPALLGNILISSIMAGLN